MTDSKMIPDWYQVKFAVMDGNVRYGILDRYSPEALAQIQEGRVIVQDAILPFRVAVPINCVTEVPFGSYDEKDEYHNYIQSEFEKAQQASKDSGKGLAVGKLISCPVADGAAYYVVTRVGKLTARVEWRGFCLDRWEYAAFGRGGSFPKKQIESFVAQDDWWGEFSKQPNPASAL